MALSAIIERLNDSYIEVNLPQDIIDLYYELLPIYTNGEFKKLLEMITYYDNIGFCNYFNRHVREMSNLKERIRHLRFTFFNGQQCNRYAIVIELSILDDKIALPEHLFGSSITICDIRPDVKMKSVSTKPLFQLAVTLHLKIDKDGEGNDYIKTYTIN